LVAAGDHEIATLSGQSTGDGSSNAARGTGYEGNLIVQWLDAASRGSGRHGLILQNPKLS